MRKIFLLLIVINLFANSSEKIINDIANNFNENLKIISDEIKCKDKICTIKKPKVIHKENKIEFYEAEKITIKIINDKNIEAEVVNLKFSKQLDYILDFALEKFTNVMFTDFDYIWRKLVAANLNLKTKINLKDEQIIISSVLTNEEGDTAKFTEFIKLENDLKDSKNLLYFLAHTPFNELYFKNIDFIRFNNYKSILSLKIDKLHGFVNYNHGALEKFITQSPHVLEIEFKDYGYGNNDFLINSFNAFPIFIDTWVEINNK